MGNKVQRNEYNVNVLVETDNSNNSNYYHGNKLVKIVRALTDSEIMTLFTENVDEQDILKIAKDWLKTQMVNDVQGYATSNVVDKVLKINNSDIVKFKLLDDEKF